MLTLTTTPITLTSIGTYGYTCRIGKIADPYEAFRLRDWERVSQLYERYDFRDAVNWSWRSDKSWHTLERRRRKAAPYMIRSILIVSPDLCRFLRCMEPGRTAIIGRPNVSGTHFAHITVGYRARRYPCVGRFLA